jgi:hypothetical protein
MKEFKERLKNRVNLKVFNSRIYLLLIISLGPIYLPAQNIVLTNINNFGYTIPTSFDKTVRLEISDPYYGTRKFLISPQQSQPLSYNRLLSQEIINNTVINIYYDLACYNNDLQRLSDIAAQRLKDEQARQVFNTFLRLAGAWLKTFDNENVQNLGKFANGIADVSDLAKEYSKGGFTPEFCNKIINSIPNYMTDKNTYVSAIANNLQTLHDYKNSSVDIKTKDLEDIAFYLSSSISNKPIVENFRMNYSNMIAPVIDYDDDGVLNSYDDCPRTWGLAKYNGCPKEVYKAKMRKERNYFIKSFWIDFGYSYLDLGEIDFTTSDFQTKLSKNSFYLNTTIPIFKHKLSNKFFGAFGLDANYLVGNITTPKITFTRTNSETGKVIDEFTDRLKIKEHAILAGLSYNLIYRTKDGGSTIFQPEFGTLVYSSLIDNVYNQKKFYAGLTFRLDYLIGGYFLGVKYQQNPYYFFDFHNNYIAFPENNLNYHLGLYYRF